MTNQKAFFLVSGTIFGLVALLHVLRLAFQLWAVLGPGASGHGHDEARLGRGGVRPRNDR